MQFKRSNRPYVIPAVSLSPPPSPPVPLELQALEHQLSCLNKPRASSIVVPETGEEGDRREMYERDVGKRRKTDRTYLLAIYRKIDMYVWK